MNIAGMNVRITIQKNNTVTDKYGNHRSVWTFYHSCWATASNQTGKEEDGAGHTSEEDLMDFTVRYSSETAEINPKGYRIKLGDAYRSVNWRSRSAMTLIPKWTRQERK